MRGKPRQDALFEHDLHLTWYAGKGKQDRALVFDPESGRGADGVRNGLCAFGESELDEVRVRHFAKTEGAKTLAKRLDELMPEVKPYSQGPGYAFPGEV